MAGRHTGPTFFGEQLCDVLTEQSIYLSRRIKPPPPPKNGDSPSLSRKLNSAIGDRRRRKINYSG